MSNKITLFNRENLLFVFLGGFFVANALIAEFMGVKIFSLEKTFGFLPANITLFGVQNLSMNLSAGVLLWPLVFIMTDIINEYYGIKGVKVLSYLTVILISFGFLMFFLSIKLSPADFWPQSHIKGSPEEALLIKEKVGDYNYAYQLIFGQGLWIIIGSIIAFLVGQLLDVLMFHRIKKITGEKFLWLRATGSTLASQLIDSYVVLFIAFYIGADWSLKTVLAIGVINYTYKILMAFLLTPLLYFVHNRIDAYLGPEKSAQLRKNALEING